MSVLAFQLFVGLTIGSSGWAQVVQSGIDGFINSTVVTLPEKSTKAADSSVTKRDVRFVANKEGQSVDERANEQLLELLVKIAQHPDTWKQIHRVLETLEANNAAYSKRIDSSASDPLPVKGLKRRQQEERLEERDWTDDKSNDVPEKLLAQAPASSSSPPTFHRWKQMLYAVKKVKNAPEGRHAQLDAIEGQRQLQDLPLSELIASPQESSANRQPPVEQDQDWIESTMTTSKLG